MISVAVLRGVKLCEEPTSRRVAYACFSVEGDLFTIPVASEESARELGTGLGEAFVIYARPVSQATEIEPVFKPDNE